MTSLREEIQLLRTDLGGEVKQLMTSLSQVSDQAEANSRRIGELVRCVAFLLKNKQVDSDN